jgi:hypothetical protein
MKRKVVQLCRTALREAEALIARIKEPANVAAPELAELLAALPLTFESAFGYVLSEFDYETRPNCNTAIAVRLLATSAERYERLRARAFSG